MHDQEVVELVGGQGQKGSGIPFSCTAADFASSKKIDRPTYVPKEQLKDVSRVADKGAHFLSPFLPSFLYPSLTFLEKTYFISCFPKVQYLMMGWMDKWMK